MLPKEKYRHALDDYSDAAAESTIRTRTLHLVLIFASVITLIAVLNSTQSGYPISEHQNLHKQWKKAQAIRAGQKGTISTSNDDTPVLSDSLLTVNAPYLADRGIATLHDYKDRDELYQHILKEAFLIRIPILGIAFHINDLGLVSTTSFVLLLSIFLFFLRNEEDSMYDLFHKAEQADKDVANEEAQKAKEIGTSIRGLAAVARRLTMMNSKPASMNDDRPPYAEKYRLYLRHYYKLHSARQVLTITPDWADRDEKRRNLATGKATDKSRPSNASQQDSFSLLLMLPNKYIQRLAIMFMFLPSFSCTVVVVHDIFTIKFADGWVSFSLALIALLLVYIININCYIVAKRAEATWTEFYTKVVQGRDAEDADYPERKGNQGTVNF